MDRPEDRRSLTRTETYYPNPAEGLDADRARERVEANPEVMPPNPTPRSQRSWQNREVMGMRAFPLLALVASALALPALVGWLSQRKPRREHLKEHEKAHRAYKKIAAMEKDFAAEGKRRRAEKKAAAKAFAKRAKEAGSAKRAKGAASEAGLPRFIMLGSRPEGKKGKRARALVLGKVVH